MRFNTIISWKTSLRRFYILISWCTPLNGIHLEIRKLKYQNVVNFFVMWFCMNGLNFEIKQILLLHVYNLIYI